jgi:hypothetical protein
LIATIRESIEQTRAALSRIESVVSTRGAAERLPGLALAKAAVALDQLSTKLGKLADKLATADVASAGRNGVR